MPTKDKVKWSRAVPIYRWNIKSSDFTGQKAYIPNYLLKTEVDFHKLLAMEYRRMWFDDIHLYSIQMKKDTNSSSGLLRSPIIKRIKHIATDSPKAKMSFTMKRFKDVPSRTKHINENMLDKKNSKSEETRKTETQRKGKTKGKTNEVIEEGKPTSPTTPENVASTKFPSHAEHMEKLRNEPPLCKAKKCPMYCTGHKYPKPHSCLSKPPEQKD